MLRKHKKGCWRGRCPDLRPIMCVGGPVLFPHTQGGAGASKPRSPSRSRAWGSQGCPGTRATGWTVVNTHKQTLLLK